MWRHSRSRGPSPAVGAAGVRLEGVCVDGRLTDVLFSGVGELVLSPAVVGLLDARVSPQRLYCADVRLVKRGDLLHFHLAYQLAVILLDRTSTERVQHRLWLGIQDITKKIGFPTTLKLDGLKILKSLISKLFWPFLKFSRYISSNVWVTKNSKQEVQRDTRLVIVRTLSPMHSPCSAHTCRGF